MDRRSAIAALAGAVGAACGRSAPRLSVGSKNFTEQLILGEIIAGHLCQSTAAKVETQLNLAGTMLAHQALQAGEIDLYPEYTGTALSSILKGDLVPEASVVRERVRQDYRTQMGAEWLDPLGFNNSFAMVVRGADARERQVRTLSEAAAFGGGWSLGVGYEFQTRQDGLPALNRVYRPTWKGAPRTMDLGLLFQALESRAVDMIAANTTDGLLLSMDVQVLADDRQAFPPYEAAIVVRLDTLEANPGLREILGRLSGRLNESAMRRLNYEVDGKKRPVAAVAAEWLKSAQLGS